MRVTCLGVLGCPLPEGCPSKCQMQAFAKKSEQAVPTPPAPLTLHVPVWPISEAKKDGRVLVLFDRNDRPLGFEGLWDKDAHHWFDMDGCAVNPTHFTELKYMAIQDSTGGGNSELEM